MVTRRIKRLWEQSVNTVPFIDPERAKLITDFYNSDAAKNLSAPVLRALAFRHILEHKTLYIGNGELIVGEKGLSPRGVPTYPELCCHSLQDLDILGSRKVTPYYVNEETRRIYEDYVIPFWNGRDESLIDQTVFQLEKLGLIEKKDLMNFKVLRLRYAYPVYDLNYRSHLEVLLDYLSRFDNLTHRHDGVSGLLKYQGHGAVTLI